MPFVIAIITIMGSAAYWYFQMRRAGSVAHEVVDKAQRLRGAYRRRKFLGKAQISPIAAVDDPGVAAVAMLIALSEAGRHGAALDDAIKTEMREVMQLPDVEETYIFARWVADHADDSNMLSFRFSKLWKTTLEASERTDFYAMAGRIIAAGGAPTPEQTTSLKLLRDRLGLTQ